MERWNYKKNSFLHLTTILHGRSVITEISSACGDKNSTSSKQDWSHSWHKINATTLQKEVKTIQNGQKIKGRFTSSEGARVCAQ
jgi:hypothetical protein